MDLKSLMKVATLAVITGPAAQADTASEVYTGQLVKYDFSADHKVTDMTIIGTPEPITDFDPEKGCLTGETGDLFRRAAIAFSSGGSPIPYHEFRLRITDSKDEVVKEAATTCDYYDPRRLAP